MSQKVAEALRALSPGDRRRLDTRDRCPGWFLIEADPDAYARRQARKEAADADGERERNGWPDPATAAEALHRAAYWRRILARGRVYFPPSPFHRGPPIEHRDGWVCAYGAIRRARLMNVKARIKASLAAKRRPVHECICGWVGDEDDRHGNDYDHAGYGACPVCGMV
jgi:hypothetical protein